MFESVESLLLKLCPGPRFSLVSEQIKRGNDVGEVWDELPVKICESGELLDPLD